MDTLRRITWRLRTGSYVRYSMKQNKNRPIRTTSSQIVMLCAALFALAFGVIGAFAVFNGITTGQVHPVSVVLGDKTMVDRNGSPSAYWTSMGLFALSGIGGPILGVLQLFEIVAEYRRKIADRRNRRDANIQHNDLNE
jgi:hypothetical protein